MPRRAKSKTEDAAGDRGTTHRVDLGKLLNPDELAKFQENARKAGRDEKTHLLAITLGIPDSETSNPSR